MTGCYYSAMTEDVQEISLKMFVLKNKDKNYIVENAPDVIPMVESGEKNAVPVGQWRDDET